MTSIGVVLCCRVADGWVGDRAPGAPDAPGGWSRLGVPMPHEYQAEACP